MSDLLLPPIAEQETDIGIDLDDAMLQVLLLSIYTTVFFGTLYVYLIKRSSREWIVIGAVSLSYLVYLAHSTVAWFMLKQNFVKDGGSPETIFTSIYYFNTGWKTLFNDICAFLLATLGDGLLIWRCFNVWNRSFCAILLPLLLLLSSISFDVAIIAIASASKLTPFPNQAHILDILTTTTFCVTAATTLSTTFLIAYRIYSVSKEDILKRSRRRFRNIVEILGQSAAAYAVASIINAVTTLPRADGSYSADTYATAFFNFVAGVAPTIMVARLALAPGNNGDLSTINHISGLQFDHSSTIGNVAPPRGDSIPVEAEHSNGHSETEKVEFNRV